MRNEVSNFQSGLILVSTAVIDILIFFRHSPASSLIGNALLFIFYFVVILGILTLIVSGINELFNNEKDKYKQEGNVFLSYLKKLAARLTNTAYNLFVSVSVIYLFILGRGIVWIELPLIVLYIAILIEIKLKSTNRIASCLVSAITYILNIPKILLNGLVEIRRDSVKPAVILFGVLYLIIGLNLFLNASTLSECIKAKSSSSIGECYKQVEWLLTSSSSEDDY